MFFPTRATTVHVLSHTRSPLASLYNAAADNTHGPPHAHTGYPSTLASPQCVQEREPGNNTILAVTLLALAAFGMTLVAICTLMGSTTSSSFGGFGFGDTIRPSVRALTGRSEAAGSDTNLTGQRLNSCQKVSPLCATGLAGLLLGSIMGKRRRATVVDQTTSCSADEPVAQAPTPLETPSRSEYSDTTAKTEEQGTPCEMGDITPKADVATKTQVRIDLAATDSRTDAQASLAPAVSDAMFQIGVTPQRHLSPSCLNSCVRAASNLSPSHLRLCRSSSQHASTLKLRKDDSQRQDFEEERSFKTPSVDTPPRASALAPPSDRDSPPGAKGILDSSSLSNEVTSTRQLDATRLAWHLAAAMSERGQGLDDVDESRGMSGLRMMRPHPITLETSCSAAHLHQPPPLTVLPTPSSLSILLDAPPPAPEAPNNHLEAPVNRPPAAPFVSAPFKSRQTQLLTGQTQLQKSQSSRELHRQAQQRSESKRTADLKVRGTSGKKQNGLKLFHTRPQLARPLPEYRPPLWAWVQTSFGTWLPSGKAKDIRV